MKPAILAPFRAPTSLLSYYLHFLELGNQEIEEPIAVAIALSGHLMMFTIAVS